MSVIPFRQAGGRVNVSNTLPFRQAGGRVNVNNVLLQAGRREG